jgi:hypothetical protein
MDYTSVQVLHFSGEFFHPLFKFKPGNFGLLWFKAQFSSHSLAVFSIKLYRYQILYIIGLIITKATSFRV